MSEQQAEKKLSIVDADHLPSYPAGIKWDIDIPADVTPLQLIDAAIEKYPDNDAIDFLGRTITYRELGQMIDKTARGLKKQGVGPGTKVGLHMPNSPYFLIMQLATWRAGGTVVTYSVLDKNKEKMKNQIADSGTTVMAVLDINDFYGPVVEMLEQGVLQKVIRCPLIDMLPDEKRRPAKLIGSLPAFLKNGLLALMGKSSSLKSKAADLKALYAKLAPRSKDNRVIAFGSLQKGWGKASNESASKAGDVAVLQYTSGTTGTLKAAMLQHFNMAANGMQIGEFFKSPSAAKPGEALMEPGKETVFISIPMDHIFAMSLALASLKGGAKLVLFPDGRDLNGSLATIQRTKATVWPTVPKLIQMINDLPDRQKYDTSSVKTVVAGSEALPAATRAGFPHEIMEGYGQTEMSPVVCCNLQGEFNAHGTLGTIAPRTEAKVVEFGNPDHILPVGEVGELLVRGPQRMAGYYNKPGDNEAVFTKDGWLRTGDLVRMDDKLRPIFVDRAKRMLKINGHGVSPLQIELAASAHPAVEEAVAIGLKDERSGDAAKLIVRLKPGNTVNEDDLRKFLQNPIVAKQEEGKEKIMGLGPLEMPKYIEFTDKPLLRNAMQKIDWFKIQTAEREKQAQAPAPKPAP